jgi:hypothetical protein
VIAANVDTIFLVTAPTGDVNPRRIERNSSRWCGRQERRRSSC